MNRIDSPGDFNDITFETMQLKIYKEELSFSQTFPSEQGRLKKWTPNVKNANSFDPYFHQLNRKKEEGKFSE